MSKAFSNSAFLILKLVNARNIEKIREGIEAYLKTAKYFSEAKIFIYENISINPICSQTDNLFSSRIQDILDFVKIKYKEDLSLEKAACKVFLSKSHFEKIFTAQIGIPFKKFLNYFRLCKAAELLRSNTTTSVTKFCFEIGFGDLSNFIKQFKNFVGCSPGKFRNCVINPEICKLRKTSTSHKLGIRTRKLNEALACNIYSICYLNRIKKTTI